jgi:hypothetical protein
VPFAHQRQRRRVVAAETARRVRAQQGQLALRAHVGPQALELDGRVAVAVRPEHGDHLAEGTHLAPVAARALHELAEERREQLRVRPVVDDEAVHRVLGAHRQVAVLVARGDQVHAARLQARLEGVQVRRGGDHDHRLGGIQARGDEGFEGVEQACVFGIELHEVAARPRVGLGMGGHFGEAGAIHSAWGCCQRGRDGRVFPVNGAASPGQKTGGFSL